MPYSVYEGRTTQVLFETSNLVVRMTSLDFVGMQHDSFNIDHMLTPQPPPGMFGNRHLMLSEFVDAGEMLLDIHFSPDLDYLIDRPPEMITIVWPQAPDDPEPVRWTCMGFVRQIDINVVLEGLITATMAIKLIGSLRILRPVLWTLSAAESYAYPTTLVPWSGGTREPMTAWGAPYTEQWETNAGTNGISVDVWQAPELGEHEVLRLQRVGTNAPLLWLAARRPRQSAGGFSAPNTDMATWLRIDAPPDGTPASGTHWTGLCFGGTMGLSGTEQNIWHFFLESETSSGRITHWRYGYMPNQSTDRRHFVTVQQGDVSIPAGTRLGLRVTARRGAGNVPSLEHRVYWGFGPDLDALPLLLISQSRLGDRDYPGRVLPHFNEWRSLCKSSNTAPLSVTYAATSERGYDAVRTRAWGDVWTGSTGTEAIGGTEAMYVLHDEETPLVGQGGLLLRMNLDAPTTPRPQRFVHMKQTQPVDHTEGRLQALYHVRQSSGSQPAYLGLYCLGRGTTPTLDWPAMGMLVEFDQRTQTYTRVLLVRWINFATDFTLLAQTPWSAPMETLLALELEWHCRSEEPTLQLMARLGTDPTFRSVPTRLALELPYPLYGLACREGPVALCWFDASPTAALDVSLGALSLYAVDAT